jgi:hypothetical protein
MRQTVWWWHNWQRQARSVTRDTGGGGAQLTRSKPRSSGDAGSKPWEGRGPRRGRGAGSLPANNPYRSQDPAKYLDHGR